MTGTSTGDGTVPRPSVGAISRPVVAHDHGIPQLVRSPLAAVESTRTERINRAVFGHAKIVQVMEGRARIETASGIHELLPGMTMALGAGRWCTVTPERSVRMWTIYFDENFLLTHMRWILSDIHRVRPGVHPDAWDGTALVLNSGIDMLRRVEPVWRQVSVAHETQPPEFAATRLIGLFTQAVEILLPGLLADHAAEPPHLSFPVRGRLADPPLTRPVQRAIDLLRSRMADAWTAGGLAVEIPISRAHLTRAFTQQTGVAPMRFLTEVRLTEFTRLLEETDLTITEAARHVGWSDPRVAASWFRRRFGIAPTQYRQHPHPQCTGEEPCESCRGVCALTPLRETGMRRVLRDSRRSAHIQPTA